MVEDQRAGVEHGEEQEEGERLVLARGEEHRRHVAADPGQRGEDPRVETGGQHDGGPRDGDHQRSRRPPEESGGIRRARRRRTCRGRPAPRRPGLVRAGDSGAPSHALAAPGARARRRPRSGRVRWGRPSCCPTRSSRTGPASPRTRGRRRRRGSSDRGSTRSRRRAAGVEAGAERRGGRGVRGLGGSVATVGLGGKGGRGATAGAGGRGDGDGRRGAARPRPRRDAPAPPAGSASARARAEPGSRG